MKLLSPIEKSHTTLYTSTMSTNKSRISGNVDDDEDDDDGVGGGGGGGGGSSGIEPSNDSDASSSSSDGSSSLNECCDMTLVDDNDMMDYDPKNEAEMMFFQVVEMLRSEQEVCVFFFHQKVLFIFSQ